MCDCVTKVNESLKKDFQKEGYSEISLRTAFVFPEMKSFPTMIVDLKKEGKQKKYEQTLFPTYCPFCGKKYSEKDAQK